jgi:flagellar biosynthesis/type III secretory pathway chaperone
MDQIVINSDLNPGRQQNWQFRFDDMFEALEQLTAILRDENKMLSEFRIGAMAGLQEKKEQLSWLIELQKEYLVRHPELLAAMEADMKARIHERGLMLEKALEENFQRLSSARLINKKIVEAVTAVVNDHYGSASGYNESGSRGLVIGREAKRNSALALNQAV